MSFMTNARLLPLEYILVPSYYKITMGLETPLSLITKLVYSPYIQPYIILIS
jgi:hypothetical protein